MNLADFKKKMIQELLSLYDEYEAGAIFRIVAEHVFDYQSTDIILNINKEIDVEQFNQLNNILSRLKNSEPVQYILGRTIFYDLEFEVEPSVLIPRQETEVLADYLIKKFRSLQQLKILDIGTGSGCIAIALKKNIPGATVYAVDISEEALRVAKTNALKNEVEINFSKLDILNPDKYIPNEFDLIVSNPPYVRKSEKETMHKNVVMYEPELALYVEDEDPLVFYHAILRYCEKTLKQKGTIALEINEIFGDKLNKLVEGTGFCEIKIIKDLNHKDRFITGIKN